MKRFTVTLSALALCAMLVGVMPAGAAEARTTTRVAAPETACQNDFGKKVPILLVHGFDSNPGMWNEGSPSMIRSLGGISNVAIKTFDYSAHHFDWVAHPDIGPKLARTIDCLASVSRKNGGPGKVIVVAHSMGGLALRYVIRWKVGTHEIADDLGLVVTLGTPHKGAAMANVFGWGWHWYCGLMVGDVPNKGAEVKKCERSGAITGMKVGSRELKELPEFPPTVPVRAIAGDMTGLTQLFVTTLRQPFYGDGVVPLTSAIDEYTTGKPGDGNFVFRCDIRHYDSYGVEPWKFQGGECWHNAMYKTGYIQESVTNGIREYLASLNRPPGKEVTAFNNLTFRIPEGLQLKPFHGEGYSSYELTCAGTLGGQNGCPKLSVYDPHEAGGDLGWQSWGWKEECGVDKPVNVGVLFIGGRPARAYAAGHCRFWQMNDGSAFIYTTDPPGGSQAQVVDSIIGSATWKN